MVIKAGNKLPCSVSEVKVNNMEQRLRVIIICQLEIRYLWKIFSSQLEVNESKTRYKARTINPLNNLDELLIDWSDERSTELESFVDNGKDDDE